MDYKQFFHTSGVPSLGRVLLLLLCLFGILDSAKAEVPIVLDINSYHPEYPWAATCVIGIDSVLNGPYRVLHYFMNTKRLPEERFANSTLRALATVDTIKPALVMLGDDNALRLLGPDLAKRNIPMVYYGINGNPRDYFTNGKLPDHFSGILERPPILLAARTLKTIMPDLKTMLLLLDDSISSRSLKQHSYNNVEIARKIGVQIDVLAISNYEDWKTTVLKAPDTYDILFASNFFTLKDSHGRVPSYQEVLQWTSDHSTIPLFGIQSGMVSDRGGVGAIHISGQQHGAQAARIAIRMLKAPREHAPRFETDKKGALLFNRKQLNRFNIELPPELLRGAEFN